jgi:hypothetical protein
MCIQATLTNLCWTSPSDRLYINISPDDVPRAMIEDDDADDL